MQKKYNISITARDTSWQRLIRGAQEYLSGGRVNFQKVDANGDVKITEDELKRGCEGSWVQAELQTCRYHCAAAIRLNNLRRASLSYIVLLALDPAIAQSLASEDSLIEDLRAAFCLIAAFLFLMAHFESSGQANRFFGRRTQHNWWLLLFPHRSKGT